jgi:hypothetical protein
MRQLHYASQVLTIGDQLADAIERGVHDFANAGRSSVWPIACFGDEREETVQILIGPSIPLLISPTWLPDDRDDPVNTGRSVDYIDDEISALDAEPGLDHNIVVYGRWAKAGDADSRWRFSGFPGLGEARDVADAVRIVNNADYEIVAATESRAPSDDVAWSNVYLIGRRVR